MKVLVHIPSRGRHKALSLAVVRWLAAIKDLENTRLLLTLDDDDTPGAELVQAMKVYPPEYPLEAIIGPHKDKVSAINADLDLFPWDVLVCASDDLYPMELEFDQAVRTDFANDVPDFDGVLWYPDKNSRICCHPVIGRKYYERDGYVFHPSYRAFYCDDELTMVAQKRGKLFQSTSVEWDHRHPNYRTRKPDELDHRNKEFMRQDYLTFCRRQSAGFPK
jgi:hypothetical protein